jgi:hypothetical protein
MTTFDFAAALREELILLLQGPGVTWNLKGIEHQLDKAITTVALKHLDAGHQKEPTP